MLFTESIVICNRSRELAETSFEKLRVALENRKTENEYLCELGIVRASIRLKETADKRQHLEVNETTDTGTTNIFPGATGCNLSGANGEGSQALYKTRRWCLH